MWGLLKRLGSECWGDHDWIYKTNPRGVWLECRRCGEESVGLELSAPRYRRTQEGAEEAHRLDAVAPARETSQVTAHGSPQPLRFAVPRAAQASGLEASATPAWDATSSSSAVAATDAERRWLQAWRALSAEERVMAERLVAGLSITRAATRPEAPNFTTRGRARGAATVAEDEQQGRMVG